MTNYLVSYGSKLFSGHQVIEANSAEEARAKVEAQGYKVKSVEVAAYED